MYNIEITKEKFSITLTKIINEISSYRRDGNHVLKDILRNIIYKNSKLIQTFNILIYLNYLVIVFILHTIIVKQFCFISISVICIDSNHYACSTLRQHKFLSNLQKKIESDEGWSSVTDDLNSVKMMLANPDNIKMHLSADLDVLCQIKPDASSLLEQLLPPNIKHSEKL